MFNRHTPLAVTFQMIDFSSADNSPPEVIVDPHERGYVPDCEQPGNVEPGQMTQIGASVVPALTYAQAIILTWIRGVQVLE